MVNLIVIPLILIWVMIPNILFLPFTQKEESHMAISAIMFVPWTLFGLYLIQ